MKDALFVAVVVVIVALGFVVFKEANLVWGMAFGRLPYRYRGKGSSRGRFSHVCTVSVSLPYRVLPRSRLKP